MDLLWRMKSLNLTTLFLSGEHDKICAYDYVPQKQEFVPSGPAGSAFGRATPESQGMQSSHLQAFFRTLETTERIFPHSAMVLRHGKVIAEGYWKPYRPDYPQMMYSLSKSVTGTAVGIAIEEGYFSLDDKLSDIFPGRGASVTSLINEPLRVRHLLNMSTGVCFNEVGSMLDSDWVRAFLESELAFRPGTKFQYNSINTYMLSAIIKEKTGQGLMEFLKPRLWEPMGLTGDRWETCPRGIEKGGWGLSLTTLDMAKLGQLYLQKGRWRVGGKWVQLVSEHWIGEATRPQIYSTFGDGQDGYGYQMWMCSSDGAYQFNGAFGQILIVIPKHDVVVAVTSGSECAFLTGSPSDIVARYFYGDAFYAPAELPENPKKNKELETMLESLKVFKPWQPHGKPTLWGRRSAHSQEKYPALSLPISAVKANGVAFVMEKNHGGILPLIQKMVHCNYSHGVTAMKVVFSDAECAVTITEDQDTNIIYAGLDGQPRYAGVTLKGEVYLTGSTAEWGKDAGNRDELRLIISFVETPNTRTMRICFEEDGISVRFDESPAFFRTVRLFGELVSGDDEMQKKLMERMLQQDKLLSKAMSFTSPAAHGSAEKKAGRGV